MLFVLQLDHRGQTKKEFRCKHAKFVFKTEVEGEMEFLFAPYSVFTVRLLWARVDQFQYEYNTTVVAWAQVVRTDFSPQDWSVSSSHYTVCVEAAIDNSVHKETLELAPWN